MTVTPELILRVAEETRRALRPQVAADWSVPARDLEWSCWATAEHLADSYFAHAARIVAQPQEWFVPASVRAEPSADPQQLLQVIDACAELLRSAGTGSDPSSRAYHPWGTSDPEGSLAMGAAEGLLHTWDISAALGGTWRPPSELCRPVLERLFPDAPDADPTDTLLWCTGRAALPSHPLLTTWRWHSSVRQ